MSSTRTHAFVVLLAAVTLTAFSGCASNNVQDTGPPQGDTVKAKHILLMYEGSERAPASITRTKEEAKILIEEIQEKIKQGEKFEDLAMAHSDCPSSKEGGDLGRFGRGQMAAAFEEASFACDVGGITDVVETPFGYHIIYRYE
jgi:parvulin-like peptidyl-prolyl isomerase